MNAGYQSECAFVCTLMYAWGENNFVRMWQKTTETVSYSQYNYNTAIRNYCKLIEYNSKQNSKVASFNHDLCQRII